jgi:hypothetical protein
MDQSGIPVSTVYGADMAADMNAAQPAHRLLRTRNSPDNHLGLPLPSGSVAVYVRHGAERLLEHEADLRDIAVDEEMEIDMGSSPDVQISAQHEQSRIDFAHSQSLPLLPGVALRSVKLDDVERVEVSNARNTGIQFELRLQLPQGSQLVRADHAVGTKNGRPLFRFNVPAGRSVAVRYQTQGFRDGILRTP